jgi:predicted XRE-type DNA-binding protein
MVFADLGYPDADERQTRLRLAHAINVAIGDKRLAQSPAARRLGVSQPKISALANYQLDGFSVERPDDIPDRARSGHRHRDPPQAALAQRRTYQRDRRVSNQRALRRSTRSSNQLMTNALTTRAAAKTGQISAIVSKLIRAGSAVRYAPSHVCRCPKPNK